MISPMLDPNDQVEAVVDHEDDLNQVLDDPNRGREKQQHLQQV